MMGQQMSARRVVCRVVGWGAVALMLVPLVACGNANNQTAKKIAEDTKQVEDFDNSLTFNAVTLEESDDRGRLWWKVKAERASYSKDKKVARIEGPKGEFFQDGKPILKVSATSGEVQQNGKKIFLKGNITAVDTRDGLTLKGNELEWEPRKDTLIVRDKLTGTHKEMNIAAQEAKFLSRERRMELAGQVVATTVKPQVQFKGDRLRWWMQKRQVESDRPVQIVRYKDKTPTDQAKGDQATFNLSTQVVTLKQNAQVVFSKPAMQIASAAIVWNMTQQTVESDQPLTVVNQEQQLTLTGRSGRMNLVANTANLLGGVTILSQKQQLNLTGDAARLDLGANMAYLTGNVRGRSDRTQANLATDRLDVNLATQDFLAQGNVNYQQAQPTLNLTGPQARGRLQDQASIVVDGGSQGGRVVTEFVIPP
jgi:LPS export ABC transporter protein LptC